MRYSQKLEARAEQDKTAIQSQWARIDHNMLEFGLLLHKRLVHIVILEVRTSIFLFGFDFRGDTYDNWLSMLIPFNTLHCLTLYLMQVC